MFEIDRDELRDLYFKDAVFSDRLIARTRRYKNVPVRRHRRPRIQKKWLKRHGTKKVFAGFEPREVLDGFPVQSFDPKETSLVFEQRLPFPSDRVQLPMMDWPGSSRHPGEVSAVKVSSMVLPRKNVDAITEISQDAYRRMRHKVLEDLRDRFRQEVEANTLGNWNVMHGLDENGRSVEEL